MLHALQSQLIPVIAPAVMERLTLLINHVLGSEPVATERLKLHRGKTLEVTLQGWPALLPAPPLLAFCITPAGLLEWRGLQRDAIAELHLRVDASNPALLLSRAASGAVPEAMIEGDAALAADMNWLMQNLRWDVTDDLERIFPSAVAQLLHRLGSGLARSLQAALRKGGEMANRARRRSS